MRVLFLQRQPCIRALKYAVGLHSAAPGVRLAFACEGATLSQFYGEGDELFERWFHLDGNPRRDLQRAIDRFQPDVIHSHNLPDHLTVLATEIGSGRVPIIHDVHDLRSLRVTPYEDGLPESDDDLLGLERRAVEGADALITVSDELLDEIEARHRAPALRAVFPNLALRRDLPEQLPAPDRRPRGRPRLVYQGTLSVNHGHYDLRDIFSRLLRAGADLGVHAARDLSEYAEMAAGNPRMRYRPPLPPATLLERLTRYDWGWAGFNAELNSAHLDTVLPNKAYEYIGSGLPVLTLGHRALARMLESEGVGISLERPEDLPERLADVDYLRLRRRVAEVRWDMTVEGAIGTVIDLYQELTGARTAA
jgi:glycosyltransferase involved in cell wall biosynthesis